MKGLENGPVTAAQATRLHAPLPSQTWTRPLTLAALRQALSAQSRLAWILLYRLGWP